MALRGLKATKRKVKTCFRYIPFHNKPLYILCIFILLFIMGYAEIKFLQKASDVILLTPEDVLRSHRHQHAGMLIAKDKPSGGAITTKNLNAGEETGKVSSRNVLSHNRRKSLSKAFSRNKTTSIYNSKDPINENTRTSYTILIASVDERRGANILTNNREIGITHNIQDTDKSKITSQLRDTLHTTALPQQQKSFNCSIVHHHYFPLCQEKLNYIGWFWNKDQCFRDVHKLDGSRCSIYRYLTHVEPYCVGARHLYKRGQSSVAVTNVDITGLLGLLSDGAYRWMRGRISFLWSNWIIGGRMFSTIRSRYRKKKVLIFLGSFAAWPGLFDMAGKGGPLGELIQWSDLITALYILGYHVTICKNLFELSKVVNIDKSKCALEGHGREFDVIYTDIKGVKTMTKNYGASNFAKYKCKLRVLDSFGTYPEYNYPQYPHRLPRGRSVWGNLNLITTQFLTLYPHTHDNHFLGFIMPNITRTNSTKINKKQNRALLYAKWASYAKKYEHYLSVVSEYFEIVATCVEDHPLPPFIYNYGPVSAERIQELLSNSKVFIGVGFPFEGPGPLEAMANGAVFLQPKFDTPVSKLNNDFFGGKPTLRKLKSQSPYMQEFVREPYCYTINVTDESVLRKTLQEIKSMKRLPPKIPKEFTSDGYLKRVHVFNEYIDYCNPYLPRWPPVDHLQIHFSLAGESCKDACMARGLVCEKTYFDLINKPSVIERYARINCTNLRTKRSLHAPSVNFFTMTCYIQAHPRLFSCMHSKDKTTRLCPCRDYENEQSAICRNCL